MELNVTFPDAGTLQFLDLTSIKVNEIIKSGYRIISAEELKYFRNSRKFLLEVMTASC